MRVWLVMWREAFLHEGVFVRVVGWINLQGFLVSEDRYDEFKWKCPCGQESEEVGVHILEAVTLCLPWGPVLGSSVVSSRPVCTRCRGLIRP